MLDPAWMQRWIQHIGRGNGHGSRPAAVAGSYAGSGLAWLIAGPVSAALACEHRALDVSIDNVTLRVDDDGEPDRMAVIDARFAALPGDPAAGLSRVTVLEDLASLVAHAADQLVGTFTALYAAVRRASPYGQTGLWGGLVDHVAADLWTQHDRGATPVELAGAWRVAAALVDALAARRPRIKARPRLFHFAGAAPPVDLPLRGTCCLYYLTPEARADDGDGMCTTCPRRTDDERVRLIDAHFLDQAAT